MDCATEFKCTANLAYEAIKVKTSEGLMGQCSVVVVSDKDYIQGMKSAITRAADAVEIAETKFVK